MQKGYPIQEAVYWNNMTLRDDMSRPAALANTYRVRLKDTDPVPVLTPLAVHGTFEVRDAA